MVRKLRRGRELGWGEDTVGPIIRPSRFLQFLLDTLRQIVVGDAYHLEVSADSEFKQLVDETWIAGTSAQVQSLDLSDLDPGMYFWRVSALDAEGYESAWSHTAHFIYPVNDFAL